MPRVLAIAASMAAIATILSADAALAPDTGDWWTNAVFYEVYPRSFADTNGDGVGDLNGIIQHLDYLADLGVDAIWIAPFYPSPQRDFGYDVSNYEGIEPQYGTMADFDRLIAEAAKRNIRVIADFVINHTSDQHPWFQESRSSRSGRKANWYVWRDPKPDGSAPNNWTSAFFSGAWQYDAGRGQFYYHKFLSQQPDLNWRNNAVKKAMYNVARFWMRRGVAGFRLDAPTTLFEDAQFRDEDWPGEYTELPEYHTVLRELRQVTNQFPGRVLIGETYAASVDELATFYGPNNNELQLPMNLGYGFINQLSATQFRNALRQSETQLDGHVPLYVFDNHDNVRSWDRYGDGQHDDAIARLIATLLLMPRCAALLYYGEEIGMRNNDPKSYDEIQDTAGKLGWPGYVGRDGERTPMQWTPERNAGFTTGASTWLPIHPGYETRNVATELGDPTSLLSYYKTLLRLRKTNAAIRGGKLMLIDENNANVLSFLRVADSDTVLVTVNFTAVPQIVHFDLLAYGIAGTRLDTLAASFDTDGSSPSLSAFTLPAFGAYVGEVR